MERFLTIPALNRGPLVSHLFGTRWVESPKALAQFLRLPEESVVAARQVHGDAIRVIQGPLSQQGPYSEGHDALITDQPGLALAIATADCVPILIVDGVQRVIAAAHAGWRGSLMGIAARAVKALSERFGSRTRDLWVGLGPSAGGCCYEVDGVVLDPLKEKFPDWQSVVRERQNGRALLDLRELNRLQLTEAGVPPNQIYRTDACTICQADRFHSYRREGRGVETMLSGIVIRQP